MKNKENKNKIKNRVAQKKRYDIRQSLTCSSIVWVNEGSRCFTCHSLRRSTHKCIVVWAKLTSHTG